MICRCTVLLAMACYSSLAIGGEKVESFALPDSRGMIHQLSDFDEHELIVIAVLGTECPLAKLYGSRLNNLAKTYQDRGVGFVAVNANVQDSLAEIAAYARVHDFTFPILKDVGNKVVDALGAERTPEVFVLDRDRVIRYRGRIDDQYGVGYVKNEPESNDLVNAMDELLTGKKVTTPVTEPAGCHIGRLREPKTDATVTYSNQIARIFQAHCIECHRGGEIAPFELTDYDEVVGWAAMIGEVVSDNRMPPWHADPKHGKFANDISLSQADRELIFQWIADGAPEGDAAQLPEPRIFVSGWQLPRSPDLVLSITETPFEVKPEGEIQYQWFSVDPKLTEDKWLSAAEIVPGNRQVVHHILAFVQEPGEKKKISDADEFLVGYVPGLRVRPLPTGMAKLIPAGSTLVFQVHYTPIGSVQFDQSKIGFVFSEPAAITHRVTTSKAINTKFSIPPHVANHEVTATSSLAPNDLMLLTLMPHMHLRGKAFRYEAEYPDGTNEVLLNVPAFDFNWQTSYRLGQPKVIPRGSRIFCVAHFDNSERNLNNPAPDQTVRWGDQTWEEMMIGYFDIATPIDPSGASSSSVIAAALIASMDQNNDGELTRAECPDKHREKFITVDSDHDGVVTLEELAASLKSK